MPRKVRAPNLFIVGAPKSGTSTLHYWLSLHPDVFMSKEKEPRYFCGFNGREWRGPGGDGFQRTIVSEHEDYLKLFSGAKEETWIGEASTDYLWCENAPTSIANQYAGEKLRFIIILRNPVERAFSEYCHTVRDGLESLSFVDSLKKEKERFADNWHPLFYHSRRGLYSSAIRRYHKIFGRDSVKILLYDDLVLDPAEFMKEIYEFLQLEHLQAPLGQKHNRSGIPRLRWAQNQIYKQSRRKQLVKFILGAKLSKRAKLFIERMNLKRSKITHWEFDFARDVFLEDIEEIEMSLDSDLSSWKTV